ncbi:MAG: hypothetical protein ACK4TI_02445 [Nitrososphaerales archaeon]
MKNDELLKIKKTLFNISDELTISKGVGYGTEADTLANMRLASVVDVCSPEVAAYVRLMDKVFRLGRFLKHKELPHEGLIDTVVDAINYLTYIVAILVEDGKIELPEIEEGVGDR